MIVTAGAAHILPRMAEAVRVVREPEPGMVQCKAPGCDNWFRKRSGRHVYCKAETCTYRRGAPPAAELVSPHGAAEEVLRRLQESDEAEVGPSMLVDRYKAVSGALRAADADALWGALIDVAAAAIWWADRAKRGELPRQDVVPVAQTARQPVGMVHAVLASHHRTFVLGEQRVSLVYELFTAREHAASTELAVTQTQGGPMEEEAREHHRAARARLAAAESALQSVEAAWRERGTTLEHLTRAAGPDRSPGSNGGGARRETQLA